MIYFLAMSEIKLLPKSYVPALRDESLRGKPFAEQCFLVFGRASELPANSPLVASLQARTTDLSMRLDTINNFEPPTLDSVQERLLADTPNRGRDLYVEFGKLVHELAGHPGGYFNILEQAKLIDKVEFGPRHSPFGLSVRYINPGSMVDRLIKLYPYLEGYHPYLAITILSGTFPTPTDMWRTLATTGTLPKPISQLSKEVMVDAQYSKLDHARLLTPIVARSVIGAFVFSTFGFVAERVFNYASLPFMRKIGSYLENDPYLSHIHALASCADSPHLIFLNLTKNQR